MTSSSAMRVLADLPWQARVVALRVQVRRFRCAMRECPRRLFAAGVPVAAGPRARRTALFAEVQRHTGLALGAAAASRLMARLVAPERAIALLGMLRLGAPKPPAQAPRVLGMVDWAKCRGRRRGTILVGLERRRAIDS